METGIRELRNHLSKYLAAVRAGDEVVVTDHGKAFARLVSLEQPRPLTSAFVPLTLDQR